MPRTDVPVADRGCQWWERCTTCPWARCIPELPPKERAALVDALKIVRQHLAAPDRALG